MIDKFSQLASNYYCFFSISTLTRAKLLSSLSKQQQRSSTTKMSSINMNTTGQSKTFRQIVSQNAGPLAFEGIGLSQNEYEPARSSKRHRTNEQSSPPSTIALNNETWDRLDEELFGDGNEVNSCGPRAIFPPLPTTTTTSGIGKGWALPLPAPTLLSQAQTALPSPPISSQPTASTTAHEHNDEEAYNTSFEADGFMEIPPMDFQPIVSSQKKPPKSAWDYPRYHKKAPCMHCYKAGSEQYCDDDHISSIVETHVDKDDNFVPRSIERSPRCYNCVGHECGRMRCPNLCTLTGTSRKKKSIEITEANSSAATVESVPAAESAETVQEKPKECNNIRCMFSHPGDPYWDKAVGYCRSDVKRLPKKDQHPSRAEQAGQPLYF